MEFSDPPHPRAPPSLPPRPVRHSQPLYREGQHSHLSPLAGSTPRADKAQVLWGPVQGQAQSTSTW